MLGPRYSRIIGSGGKKGAGRARGKNGLRTVELDGWLMGAGRFFWRMTRDIARLTVALFVVLALVGSLSASASASLTIEQPSNGNVSNEATPTFSGSTTDLLVEVQLQIYVGEGVSGSPAETLNTLTPPLTGSWSAGPSAHLPDGVYTAQAVQSLFESEPEQTSNPVTFRVDTAPPEVSLKGPPSLSNDTTPSFTGEASDTTPVVVHVFNSSHTEVSAAEANNAPGSWSSGGASPALADGKYTAVATQKSSLGNPPGESNTVSFTVSTASPELSLKGPSSPTNDTTPSFSGEASDTTPVVVHVFNSSHTQVAVAEANNAPGSWNSGGASPALADGSYTAVATQKSSLGNPPGESNTVAFTVITASPTVTLTQPESPTKDTTPSFSGFASDTKQVVVHILNSAHSQVAEAFASGTGGSWSSGGASPSLSDGQYTAFATQESSIGNGTGESKPVSFTVNTAPPTVTLNSVKSLSNDTTPSFTGFGSDVEPVTIDIYKGSSPGGTVVASASAEGNQGDWSSNAASPPLPDGQYTAVAFQASSLGNSTGHSNAVTFTVATAPPTVTLNQPTTPSNHTRPSFSGSASDVEPITINVYAGSKPEGPVVASTAASGTGGGWSSGQASPELPTGQYTAIATQPSSLGNSPGISSPVTFVVDTRSPTVSLSGPPPLSNDSTPRFTGAASDTTKVVVHILNGSSSEVDSATANPSGGGWSTENESSLPSGSYTAYATQASSLGNPQGVSGTVSFTINTNPPSVTLKSPGRTNNTTPSFTGSGSDTTQVTITIYHEGSPVSSASASGTGGAWTSGPASPPLPNGRYTAIATQPSSLGNAAGKSAAETFEVDTSSPTVILNAPPTPSNNTTPAFSGTASDTEPITVRVYKGTKAEGPVVASTTAPGTGGAWSSGAASPALPSGTYTVNATQPSSLGNAAGISASVTFVVETAPPHVTLAPIAKLSNNTAPVFTGTASDTTPVTVEIFPGTKVLGTPPPYTATATPVGGSWTSAAATPALPEGPYTAIAIQPSSLGNPAGESSTISFTVHTAPPIVTLEQPKSPSNNTTPSFKGTASDTTKVVVHVYDAAKLEVTNVTTSPGTGGAYTTPSVTKLADGTYTATATQESSLKNPEGVSTVVTFVVNTLPPTVRLEAPPSPSNVRAPVFTGEATDSTNVTISIYAGTKVGGSAISTASATPPPGGGKWTSAPATLLPNVQQTYTAVATEPSSIGNGPGTSPIIHFTVDPLAPSVDLKAPPTWSNNKTPAFSGSATDITPVTVEIYAGANVQGSPRPVAEATATGTGGGWTSGPVSPPLPDGEYTVVASQHNRVNATEVGTSHHFTFAIDTVAPHVALSSPANGSSGGGAVVAAGVAGTEPGDVPQVTAQLFAGASISSGQSPIQSILVNAVGNGWSATFAGLSPGTYTLRAQQSDRAGNVGTSGASTYVVLGPPASAAHASPSPKAAFAWFPAAPAVGERVSLVSSSTDPGSPITGFAWDLAGNGALVPGTQLLSTTFRTSGNHLVRLRVTDANGLSSLATETIRVAARKPTLMKPFPSVRIVTSRASGGVRLTLLIVQAPVGARIIVTCKGEGCPARSQTRLAKSSRARAVWVAFAGFERLLPAGVKLEVRVFKAGQIGKYTRLVVRSGSPPERYDTCLGPAGVRPMRCPKK